MLLVDVNFPPDFSAGGAWDGFQVTQWLQYVHTQRLPVIIISGADRVEYKKYAAAAGAEAFLTKPINNSLLLNSIESALASPSVMKSGFIGLKMAALP